MSGLVDEFDLYFVSQKEIDTFLRKAEKDLEHGWYPQREFELHVDPKYPGSNFQEFSGPCMVTILQVKWKSPESADFECTVHSPRSSNHLLLKCKGYLRHSTWLERR